MPPLNVTISIPSLHNGISDQPPSSRLPNQIESCQNVVFSVRDGASKRPGSWILREMDGTGLTEDGARLFHLARDESEQYHLLIGAGGELRVMEVGFLDAVVTISSDAAAYLAANTPMRDQYRVVTVADTTFIVNTTVPVKTKTSASYSVETSHKNYDVMISYTPTTGSYNRSEDDGTYGLRGYYKYDPGQSSTYAKWIGPTMSGTSFATPTGNYDDSGNNPGGFKVAFQTLNVDITGGTWTQATKRLVKTGAFTSYTYASGDRIYITGGTGVTAGWRSIASKVSNDEIELTDTTGFTVNNTDTTTDAIGQQFDVSVQLDNVALTDMYDVASRFQQALRDAGAFHACVAWVSTGAQAGHFEITSPYRGSSATTFDPTAPSSGYDYTTVGRPFATGTIVAGTGSPTTNTDDVDSRWTSVAAPNQANASIDATTMPVVLRRTAKSSLPSTAATFSLDLATWNDRLSGDDSSNPAPSIWKNGNTLEDLIYFRGRLGFGGGENIVFSQADNVFALYLDNAFNVVDSDPVDVQLASDQVTVIDFLVPIRKSVLVFTKAGRQFELRPDTLAPGKVSATPITSYKTVSVKPVVIDPSVYFAVQSEGAIHLYEYTYDDISLLSAATSVSSHASNLVATRADNHVYKSQLLSLQASPETGMVLLLMSRFYDPASTPLYSAIDLFVYRAFYEGQQKVQSAWTQHVFYTGTALSDDYFVRDVCCVADMVYFVTTHYNGTSERWYVERMALTTEKVNEDEVESVIS